MKNLLAGLLMICGLNMSANANPLFDDLRLAFVGSAKTAIEFTDHGKTQLEFLSNFVEGGRFNGQSIWALDTGFLGTVLPDSGKVDNVDWASGAKIHLSPFIKQYVKLSPEWEFVGKLEIDARASYNWTRKHPTYGIAIAYPFK